MKLFNTRRHNVTFKAKLLPSGMVELASTGKLSNLFEGQNVVVVRETKKTIYSSITGRRLGTKELVVGRGKVKVNGTRIIVDMLDNRPLDAKGEVVEVIVKPTIG